MKYFIKTALRIFITFELIQFISHLMLSIINGFQHNDPVKYINYGVGLFIYIIFSVLIWINAEKIGNKIIGEKHNVNKDDSINDKNIISIGIIIFGLYIIMKYTPIIFTNISGYIIFLLKKKNISNNYSELLIGSIINLLSLIADIVAAYIFIKYGQKIFKLGLNEKENSGK